MNAALSKALLLLPPSLSLLYSIYTQLFLSGWHECKWTQHLDSIATRTGVLVATISYAMALDAVCTDTDRSFSIAFLLSSLISCCFSYVLIIRTRKDCITGPKPDAAVVGNAVKKVFICTGSNTGIGKETARQLLSAGGTGEKNEVLTRFCPQR